MKSSLSATYPRTKSNTAVSGRNLSEASLAKMAEIVALAVHDETAFMREELNRHSKVIHDLTKRLNSCEKDLNEKGAQGTQEAE